MTDATTLSDNAPPVQIVSDSQFSGVWFVWVFAIVWNTFVAFMITGAWRDRATNPMPHWTIWLYAAFAAAGALLLLMAIYFTTRMFRMGGATFEYQSAPCVVGGMVTGTVRVPHGFIYRNPIELCLACLRPDDQFPYCLWEQMQTLDRFSEGSAITHIPVYFKIPADAKPTSHNGGKIYWQVSVKTKTAHGSYYAVFAIPVTTAAPLPDLSLIPDSTIPFISDESSGRLQAHHIHLTQSPSGGCRAEFDARRNWSMASLFFFGGLWFAGIAGALPRLTEVPAAAMPILIGLAIIGVVAIFTGLRLYLMEVVITAQHGSLTIQRITGPFTSERRIAADRITDIIAVKSSVQVNGNPWYTVSASGSINGPIKLAGMIPDKHDAEHLAAEMKKAVFGNA